MKKKGFTLIEVLLVTTLLASIGLAVFTCLSSGLKLWTRTQGLSVEQDVVLFFDRFTVEAGNAFLFSTLPLEGSDSMLAFPTIIYTKTDPRGSRSQELYGDQFGAVRYSFDALSGSILREQADYGRASRGEFLTPRIMASGVKAVRFSYYYPGQTGKPSVFKGGDILPEGVLIEVDLPDSFGEKVMARYIAMPAGV